MSSQTVDFDSLAQKYGLTISDMPASARTPGLLEPGNIDLTKRPIVHNADGSVSTVRSMSFEQDGREVLVPTVSDDGRILSDDDAIKAYRTTGQHLGIFDNPDNATAYAQKLHNDYAAGRIPGYPATGSHSGSPAKAAAPDYDGLATKHGLTILDKPPQAKAPDYEALAAQHGLTLSDAPEPPAAGPAADLPAGVPAGARFMRNQDGSTTWWDKQGEHKTAVTGPPLDLGSEAEDEGQAPAAKPLPAHIPGTELTGLPAAGAIPHPTLTPDAGGQPATPAPRFIHERGFSLPAGEYAPANAAERAYIHAPYQLPTSKDDFNTYIPVPLGGGGFTPIRTSTAKAVANTVLGQVNPETLGIMLTAEFGAEGLKAIANAPRVVAWLADAAPAVKKAVDIGASTAVPAAFTVQQGVEAGKQGMAAYEAQKAGKPAEAEQHLVSAFTNLVMAGLSAAGAVEVGRRTGAQYPPAAEMPSTRNPITGEVIPGEAVGATPTPPVTPQQATTTAASLESGGRRLAASAWRELDRSMLPVGTYKGKQVFLLPPETIHGAPIPEQIPNPNEPWQPAVTVLRPNPETYGVHTIVDADRNILVRGSAAEATNWLRRNNVSVNAPPEIRGEMGTQLATPSERVNVPNRFEAEAEAGAGPAPDYEALAAEHGLTVSDKAPETQPVASPAPETQPAASTPAPAAPVELSPAEITRAPETPANNAPEAPTTNPAAPAEAVAPPEKRDYSSSQVNLPAPVADAVRAHAALVPNDKLAADGREDHPHITVKYGLHGSDPAEVAAVLKDQPPITATIGKTSLFHTDDADVLKADVDSPDLHALNAKIADALPHTDTHPEYKPHVTIAYLKKGEGTPYAGQDVPGLTGQQVTFDRLTFSSKDGNETEIPLNGTVAPAQQPVAETPQAAEPAANSADPFTLALIERAKAHNELTRVQDALKNVGTLRPTEVGPERIRLGQALQAAKQAFRDAQTKVEQLQKESPSALAWTSPAAIPDRTPTEKYSDPAEYYNAVRAEQKANHRFIGGEGNRLAGVQGKHGAAEARRKIHADTNAARGAYTGNYTEVENALGKPAADQLRAEVEQHAPQQLPRREDFRHFWHSLHTGEKIAGPQGALEITHAIAFSMQPILPTRGGWGAIGRASHEVSEITAKLPDGSEQKFRAPELESYLYDGKLPAAQSTEGAVPAPKSAWRAMYEQAIAIGATPAEAKTLTDRKLGPEGKAAPAKAPAPAPEKPQVKPEVSKPVNAPRGDQILSAGAWADSFQPGERISYTWNQKRITATVIGRGQPGEDGDRLKVQPDGGGLTTLLNGTSARQKDVERLAAPTAEEKPAPAEKPHEVPHNFTVGQHVIVATPDDERERPAEVIMLELRRFPDGIRDGIRVRFDDDHTERTVHWERVKPAPAPAETDIAAAAGLTPEQIVEAAVKAIADKRGITPAPAAAPKAPTQTSAPAPAPRAPAPKAPASANPLRGAADEARARLRAKYNGTTLQSGIDPQDLIDLATIGAEHILDGASEFAAWSKNVMADIGDLVQAIAASTKQSTDAVLRQVHTLSAQAAARFTPTATKEVSPKGNEESTIKAEQSDALVEPAGATDREPLGNQLPESSAGAEESGNVPQAGGRQRGTRRKGHGAGQGKRPKLDGNAGTSQPGVGQASERGLENSPPRAQNPESNRHEHDYRIPDDRVISGTPEVRAKANIAAIQLLRQLQEEKRSATVDEQRTLAGYVGWGAVPQLFAGNTPEWQAAQNELRGVLNEQEYAAAELSTANAHYTGDQMVDAMWDALLHLGARPGMSWLEPAIGVGNFFGRQPAQLLEGARRVGIDKEPLAAQIAQFLYPDSGIDVVALEKAEMPEDYFDAAISNIPFGPFGVHDPAFRNLKYLEKPIHNYFFAKALSLVRPGGIVAFVTSRYTMDGYDGAHTAFRKWINEKADFLGAVRLPSNAFRQSSGTHVITDVVFLRRRLPGAERAGEKWEGVKDRALRGGPWNEQHAVPTNEYYHAHPENVLGTEKLARGEFSDHDYNIEGTVTRQSVADILQRTLPANAFQTWQAGPRQRQIALREINAPAELAKLGGLFFDQKGKLYRKTSKGAAIPVEAGEVVRQRIRGQLQIRDAINALTDAELKDLPAPELDKLRKVLNFAYDRFVKSHGPVSSRSNQAALAGDPDAPNVLSIERRYDPKTNTAEKAGLFDHRVLWPPKSVEHAADAKEALSITLNDTGRVDWDHMQQLTGRTPEELQSELKGLVFLDPESRVWQLAEEYLSGSVRTKLKQARAIAKMEPGFADNVAALELAQPEDIPPGEIAAQLGASWVPLDVYSQYAKEILAANVPVEVKYVAGTWSATSPWDHGKSSWGTARLSAHDILEDALNARLPKVYDHDKDGDHLNTTETLTAQAKVREMHAHFEQWLFGEPARGTEMSRIYNDLRNDLRLRTFDGSHLTLPGMSRDAAVLRTGNLEPHQLAAVWRQIVQPNVLLAHAVGAGKTFEMIAAGMELKRLGLISRPMYVVPNETIGGWQMQFNALYPQARVLVFSDKDLEKKRRQLAMAQIATGEWDAVVMPHSSFKLLRTGDEIFNQHLEELKHELEEGIREAVGAGMDTRRVKQMAKQAENLVAGLEKRRNAERQDLTVSWEQLGIDQLFVDESHYFKKLGFATRQAGIAGIDHTANQMTFDLLMKMRHVQQHGRGVVFATGTPITNTMGELYSIMRYLIEPELKARGIGRFDEWAAEYGRTNPVFERKTEGGGYRTKMRFSNFVNLPELAQLFRSFADVVTSDMLNIPRPTLATGARQPVETELSEDQREIQPSLEARGAAIRANPRKALPDNMLNVFTDAQKMTLDVRLLKPELPDDPTNRLNAAAKRIHAIWQDSEKARGTQLVFCDLGVPADAARSRARISTFSVYDDLVAKLVKLGIPAEEIATVYQVKNKNDRAKLFAAVNEGKIRVVLGSTKKLGVGVNVQDRVVALHHLDIPHTPAELEQREGRAIRQGNRNPEVSVFYYLTRGSLDELKFQNVTRKAKFINQVMQGKSTVRRAEDVSGMVPSLEMFSAMASCDPRVFRKMEVDAELDRLGAIHSGWRNAQWNDRWAVDREIPAAIANLTRRIERARRMIALRDKAGRVWKVGKQTWQGDGIQNEVGEALGKRIQELRDRKNDQTTEPIGSAYGIPLAADGNWVSFNKNTDDYVQVGTSGVGLAQSISHFITHLEDRIARDETQIAKSESDRADLEANLNKPWSHAEEYSKLEAEQKNLLAELGGNKGDDAAAVADDEVSDDSVEAEEAGDEEETPASPEETPAASEETPAPVSPKHPGERGAIAASALTAVPQAVEALVREDVLPALRGAKSGAQTLIKGMVEVLNPRSGVDTKLLDAVYQLKGDREKAEFLMKAAVDAMSKLAAHPAKPLLDQVARDRKDLIGYGLTPLQAFQVDMMDRIKTGEPQRAPEFQNIADFLRQADDALYQAQSKFRDITQLENHQRVLWKEIPGRNGKPGYRGAGRRPLQGTKGQFKRHVFEDMSEGIALGGVPYTYNPVDNFIRHYVDVMKYLTAQQWWKMAKKMGARVFVKFGKQPPEGFTKLNDAIAGSFRKVTEGMVVNGEWYVEKGMARLLNNYLSRDLLREEGTAAGTLGKALLGAKNMYTAVELGFSAFHFTFETLESGGSSIGLGLQKLVNRGIKQGDMRALASGLADIAKGITIAPAARENWRLGKSAVEYLKDPAAFAATPEGKALLAAYPNARELMSDLFAGGAKLDVYNEYKLDSLRTFHENADKGNYIGAGLRALAAAPQAVMIPLFEWYIPRLKVGVFLREFSSELMERQAEITAGTLTRGQLARQVWDFVEDRFGEMNYDNLFWNRTFKTAAQILMRSPTWKFGSIRAGFKAVGQGKELFRSTILPPAGPGGGRGPRHAPRLTREFSWLMGMAVLTAAVGSLVTFAFTHKRPQELKDAYWPRTDPDDPEQRVSPATYFKEYAGAAHDPAGYAAGGISGILGRALEVLHNRKYFGEKIWSENDEAAQTALKILLHFLPQPIASQSYQRVRGEGGNIAQAVPGFLGFPKAPRWVNQTAAESLMADYAHEQQPQAGREPNERAQLRSQIRRMVQNQKLDQARQLAEQSVDAGKLTDEDVERALDQAQYTPLVAEFKRLTLDRAIRVMRVANPAEKEQLMPVLGDMLDNRMDKLPPAEQDRIVFELKKAKLIQ